MAQLRPLPKPLAVFAANDEHALEVLESCAERGAERARTGGDCRRGKLPAGARRA